MKVVAWHAIQTRRIMHQRGTVLEIEDTEAESLLKRGAVITEQQWADYSAAERLRASQATNALPLG